MLTAQHWDWPQCNSLSDTELRNHPAQAPMSVVLRISPLFYLSQHTCKISSFLVNNRGLLWQRRGWMVVEQLCNLKWLILTMSKFGKVCLGRSAPIPFLRVNPIRALWFQKQGHLCFTPCFLSLPLSQLLYQIYPEHTSLGTGYSWSSPTSVSCSLLIPFPCIPELC